MRLAAVSLSLRLAFVPMATSTRLSLVSTMMRRSRSYLRVPFIPSHSRMRRLEKSRLDAKPSAMEWSVTRYGAMRWVSLMSVRFSRRSKSRSSSSMPARSTTNSFASKGGKSEML